jgi:hypothetical protein
MSRENPTYLERNPGIGEELPSHLTQAEAGERAVGGPKEIIARLKASLPEGTTTQGSFKTGGTVPKTGPYTLHKGETVTPAPTDSTAAPDQSAAAPTQTDDQTPDQSATPDESPKDEPVKFTRAYSNFQEALVELADGLGVSRSATIPHIRGQEPAEHFQTVGQVLTQAGGLTENLLTASHTAYGKNGGATVAYPAQKLRETIIPAKSEPAKAAIDKCRAFVNMAAKLIGDDVPAIQTAKSQIEVLGRHDGQGMILQDLLVALINIPHPVIQAVARAHSGTKDGGHSAQRRAAKL